MPTRVVPAGSPLSREGQCGSAPLDWFESEECAAILAQRVEACTENPFLHDGAPDESMREWNAYWAGMREHPPDEKVSTGPN